MTDIRYWLWLSLKKGIGSVKIAELLARFETPEAVFNADEASLSALPELTKRNVAQLADKSLVAAERVAEKCKRHGIRILTFDNPAYPNLLKEIYDPPYVLYVRCKERIDLNHHLPLAVVGTRTCSDYGVTMSEDLAYHLAREGVTIVSGMARGIDGAAATGALRAGGKTIAVLGNGLDICYPKMHTELMEQIIENGMVISEHPPGVLPFSSNFLPRNRIITGLSRGTLIVEAPKRSGAINSANWTIEQGRELFVVPGDVTRPSAQGSNQLLTEGALPVLRAEDVVSVYSEWYQDFLEANKPIGDAPHSILPPYGEVFSPKAKGFGKKNKNESAPRKKDSASASKTEENVFAAPDASLSETEKAILLLLGASPVHLDTLAENGIPAGQSAATLTLLELKGYVRSLPGKQYIRLK